MSDNPRHARPWTLLWTYYDKRFGQIPKGITGRHRKQATK